ncbi:MAG: STAS domain-containing protein [Sphingomonas sp.]
MNLAPSPLDLPGLAEPIVMPAHAGTVTAEDLKVRLILAADFGDGMMVDASAVESVGQGVLQVLLAARREAEETGQSFAIVDASPAFVVRAATLGLADDLGLAKEEESLS